MSRPSQPKRPSTGKSPRQAMTLHRRTSAASRRQTPRVPARRTRPPKTPKDRCCRDQPTLSHCRRPVRLRYARRTSSDCGLSNSCSRILKSTELQRRCDTTKDSLAPCRLSTRQAWRHRPRSCREPRTCSTYPPTAGLRSPSSSRRTPSPPTSPTASQSSPASAESCC